MAETSVDVSFPYNVTEPLSRITEATLRRREFQHELLILKNVNNSPARIKLRTGDPAIARLKGVSAHPIVYVGYFDHMVEDVSDASNKGRDTTLVFVGATWVMKASRQRVWRNMTISEIARHILREYRLTADVEDSSIRIPQINQSGESDWAFLCRIAKQYGYVVYPTGVTVHFHSRFRSIEAKMRAATMLKYSNKIVPERSQIFTFKPRVGEVAPSPDAMKAQRYAMGVDPRTAQQWGSHDDGTPTFAVRSEANAAIFSRFERMTANTPQELAAKTQGRQDDVAWVHRAQAVVDGHAHTAPTDVLYLDGLQGEYDGYWTVIGVDHVFQNKYQYRMSVEVGSNTLGPPISPFTPDNNVPIDDDALMRRNTVVPTPVLQVPGGLTDVGILQGRGGPTGVAWRSNIDNLDPLPAENPVPGWIRARHDYVRG